MTTPMPCALPALNDDERKRLWFLIDLYAQWYSVYDDPRGDEGTQEYIAARAELRTALGFDDRERENGS